MPTRQGKTTNINGLMPETTDTELEEDYVVISESDQMTTVNEAASKVFLMHFLLSNNLSDSTAINIIEQELKDACGNNPVAIADIVVSLRAVQSKFDQKQQGMYHELYTSLMSALSSVEIDSFANNSLAKLYRSIFDNSALLIQEISDGFNFSGMYREGENRVPREPFGMRFKKHLGKNTIGLFNSNGETISNVGLLHPESILSKISGVVGINYAPQLYNNIPYVYSSKVQGEPQRLRIGAQIEQTLIRPSVSNVFKNFLKVLNVANNTTEKVNYLYINLQKTSKNITDGFERKAESLRTNTLHDELGRMPGVAVVTLPADNSNFLKGFSKEEGHALTHKHKNDFIELTDLFDDVCKSIVENSNDFNISDQIKEKIFGKNNFESVSQIKQHLKDLFYSAAKEMLGDEASDKSKISMEQRQAIYFHFVKHKLTELLVTSLNPEYFNISCKDAIDRAGVHNLWNLLCGRIDRGQEMSLQEFELILNMPAILVKDRPVNAHVNILSNALGQLYFHLPQEKKNLIPWVFDWLQVNSCWSQQDVSKVFTWTYDKSQEQNYYNYHGMPYNDLYMAVSIGNDSKVKNILSTLATGLVVSNLIYDSDTNKNDTVLMCATRNGNFDIFLDLLEAHDRLETNKGVMQTNPLRGLRSDAGTSKDSILNVLFKCLETESVDIEGKSSIVGSKTQLDVCIEKFVASILSTQGMKATVLGENYHAYSNVIDEEGFTPIMRLAKTGNYQLLNKIASMCAEKNVKVTDFFEIDKEHLVMLAVNGKGEQHTLFIETLLALTETTDVSKKICEIFVKTLSERNPKNDGTVVAIALMKQLIIAEEYAISSQWAQCVRNAMIQYKFSTDYYIVHMFENILKNAVNEKNHKNEPEYEQLMMLRIKIEIEREKNEQAFAQVVENIKKCTIASVDLKNVDNFRLMEAFRSGAQLQYSKEENRDDASTKLLDAYKKYLVIAITKDPKTKYLLSSLIFDINNQRFNIDIEVTALVTLAQNLNELEQRNGLYLSLFSGIAQIFSSTSNMTNEEYGVRIEGYSILLNENMALLPNDSSNLAIINQCKRLSSADIMNVTSRRNNLGAAPAAAKAPDLVAKAPDTAAPAAAAPAAAAKVSEQVTEEVTKEPADTAAPAAAKAPDTASPVAAAKVSEQVTEQVTEEVTKEPADTAATAANVAASVTPSQPVDSDRLHSDSSSKMSFLTTFKNFIYDWLIKPFITLFRKLTSIFTTGNTNDTENLKREKNSNTKSVYEDPLYNDVFNYFEGKIIKMENSIKFGIIPHSTQQECRRELEQLTSDLEFIREPLGIGNKLEFCQRTKKHMNNRRVVSQDNSEIYNLSTNIQTNSMLPNYERFCEEYEILKKVADYESKLGSVANLKKG